MWRLDVDNVIFINDTGCIDIDEENNDGDDSKNEAKHIIIDLSTESAYLSIFNQVCVGTLDFQGFM